MTSLTPNETVPPHSYVTTEDRLRSVSLFGPAPFFLVTTGLRAAYTVAGSAATGGEQEMAIAAGRVAPIFLGEDEGDVPATIETAPWMGDGEQIAVLSVAAVLLTKTDYEADGGAVVTRRAAAGTLISLLLGNGANVPAATYLITATFVSTRGTKRQTAIRATVPVAASTRVT